MNHLKACPTCHEQPEVRHEPGNVVLFCARHGHMAMGDDLKTAIHHWNMYVIFTEKVA